jgi:hypothetical protein
MTSHPLVPVRRAVLVVLLLLLASPSVAAAGSRAVEPVPPSGTTYNRLAVAWWQYALGQPESTNPLLDTTGASCATGQSGPVFFLVGSFSSDPVVRDCTVAGGKFLFFPMLNAFEVHVPGDGLDTERLVYKAFLKHGFRAIQLRASVDGVPVADLKPKKTPFHVCAAPVAGCAPSSFSITLPGGNIFGIDAGTYAPAVQEGFYLLLPPLKPGLHTITFGGKSHFDKKLFRQDITYRLRVT